jgi:TatD DNase family protein
MIDSHCHLDCDAFDDDREAVLERAYARGVTDAVLPAVDERSWENIARLVGQSASLRIHPAWGIHPVALPGMAPEDDDGVLVRLGVHARRSPSVAIGECGLDTSIDLTRAPLERQGRVLRAQLALAEELDLPVILHARGPGCYATLLAVLKTVAFPRRGGVLHSYGGGVDLLRKFLELPLFFGFAGPATYANARKVRASIAAVPADRLLAETDAPDQTPEPHRPGRSEPAYLADVIRGIAAARDVATVEMAVATADNARRLFNLA